MILSLYQLHVVGSYLRPYEANSLGEACSCRAFLLDPAVACLWCGLPKNTGDASDQVSCRCVPVPLQRDEEILAEVRKRLEVVELARKDRVLSQIADRSQAVIMLKSIAADDYVVMPVWQEFVERWREFHREICDLEHECAFVERLGERFGKCLRDLFLAPALSARNNKVDKLFAASTAAVANPRKRSRRRIVAENSFMVSRPADYMRVMAQCFREVHQELCASWEAETTDFLRLYWLGEQLSAQVAAFEAWTRLPEFAPYVKELLGHVRTECLGGTADQEGVLTGLWRVLAAMLEERPLISAAAFERAVKDARDASWWTWAAPPPPPARTAVPEDDAPRERKRARWDRERDVDQMFADFAALLS